LQRSVDAAGIGIRLKPDNSIIEAVLNISGNDNPIEHTFVVSADGSLSHVTMRRRSTVPPDASPSTTNRSESHDGTRRPVNGAGTSLVIRTTESNSVPDLVPLKVGVPVYDLSVEGSPEFFANNILVHNSPLPQEGGQFVVDRFRRDFPMPKCTRFVRFWDKAGTLAGGNWTSGVLMGATEDNRFAVLDMKRFQLDSYNRDELILATAKEDGKDTTIGLEQEGGSGGKQSVEVSLRKMAGFAIRTIKPNRHIAKGGKAGRADPWSTQVNGSNVWLSFGRWNIDFIEEHRYFPFGRNDDIVDASVGAFTIIAQPLKRRVGGMTASTKYMNKGHKVYS